MNHNTVVCSILICGVSMAFGVDQAAGQSQHPETRWERMRQGQQVASSSIMLRRTTSALDRGQNEEQAHALRAVSMFAVSPAEPPKFFEHDLIQIIVQETSRASSQHELETEKEYTKEMGINAWPDLRLSDLLELQLEAGDTANLPRLDLDFSREFEGEGEYERQDDLTARLTAEVIEVLPNGNLVLEARTRIKNDEEELSIQVTGVCRPDDVSADNTVLSNRIHDLKITKNHSGQLKDTNEPGIISKALNAVFAF